MGLVGGRELLGEPALQAQRRDLSGELDDQHCISEAAEQLRPVEAAGDEQEGQAGREPQQESEEVGPSAPRQRGDIVLAPGYAQCAAPQFGPVPMSTPSGTLRVTAGSAACTMTSRITAPARSTAASGTSNTNSSWTCISIRTRPSPSRSSVGHIRAIARLMMSALVPWIGALTAARSAPWRSCWTLLLMLGKWVLRPNKVVVKPVS